MKYFPLLTGVIGGVLVPGSLMLASTMIDEPRRLEIIPETLAISPERPAGTYYHQVVNKYYDRDGKELGVLSATHVVDPNYCKPGVSRNQVIAFDNGEGGLTFIDRRQGETMRQTINTSTSAVYYSQVK